MPQDRVLEHYELAGLRVDAADNLLNNWFGLLLRKYDARMIRIFNPPGGMDYHLKVPKLGVELYVNDIRRIRLMSNEERSDLTVKLFTLQIIVQN